MKSLERRFNNITRRNPSWSSYTCFASAILGQRFSRQTIHRWFYKLIEKDDYAINETREVLRHLECLTNIVRTTRIKEKSDREQCQTR